MCLINLLLIYKIIINSINCCYIIFIYYYFFNIKDGFGDQRLDSILRGLFQPNGVCDSIICGEDKEERFEVSNSDC